MRTIAVLALITLSACATPAYNYVPVQTEISEPPIGAIQTVRVGDQMLRQGMFTEHEGIRLGEVVKIGLVTTFELLPGEYMKTGTNSSGSFYLPTELRDSGKVVPGALAGNIFKLVLLKPDGRSICVVTIANETVCGKSDAIEKVVVPIVSENSFQQTLIYNGRSGSVIKIGYREFYGNRARPDFSNEVEYDLGLSKSIAYQGAEIEVIEADNVRIRYVVRSNFNEAN